MTNTIQVKYVISYYHIKGEKVKIVEEQIRIAAFKWIEEQVQIYGEVLPRTLLEKGFIFNGQRITLVGPQVFGNPASLRKFHFHYHGCRWPL